MSSNPQVICFDRIYLALRHSNFSVVFLTSGQHYVSHLTVMVMIRVIMMIMMIVMIRVIMMIVLIMRSMVGGLVKIIAQR